MGSREGGRRRVLASDGDHAAFYRWPSHEAGPRPLLALTFPRNERRSAGPASGDRSQPVSLAKNDAAATTARAQAWAERHGSTQWCRRAVFPGWRPCPTQGPPATAWRVW